MGTPLGLRSQTWAGQWGQPSAAQAPSTREGFISELRSCHQRLLERNEEREEYTRRLLSRRLRGLLTGASYDVVPTSIVAAKNWNRVSLREPVGINTANGRIVSTHAAASTVPGMPERIYVAEMPNTPMLM